MSNPYVHPAQPSCPPPAYDNPAFLNDSRASSQLSGQTSDSQFPHHYSHGRYPPPYKVYPTVPNHQTPTQTPPLPHHQYHPQPPPVVTQQSPPPQQQFILFPPETDKKSVICGTILTVCSILSFIMFMVFLVKYPSSFFYVTLPAQTILSCLTGTMLISAGRNASNPGCFFGCTIFFGIGNVIIALFHVTQTGSYFGNGDYERYGGVSFDGNASVASVLVFSILTMVATLVALWFGCYGGCCAPRTPVLGVMRGQETNGNVAYVHTAHVMGPRPI